MAKYSNVDMKSRFAEITRGLTQEQIAEKLDCSVGQVNMMLSGKRKLHSKWIVRIAKAFNVPEWQLLTTRDEIYPPHERAIIEAYFRASKHRRQTIDELLGITDGALVDNVPIIVEAKKNKPTAYKKHMTKR